MISIQNKAADNTAILTYREADLDSVSATAAILRSEMSGNLPYSPASIFRFAFEHTNEGAPTRVTDRFCQVMITLQPSNVQVFDSDFLEVLEKLICFFMKEITSLSRYFLMMFAKQAGPVSTIAAPKFAARHLTLRVFEFAFGLLEKPPRKAMRNFTTTRAPKIALRAEYSFRTRDSEWRGP